MSAPLFDHVLGLADDALVSAQRMGWWISRAPELEEDVALANIGLDQLGQARTLLDYAGRVEGAGRGEDDLAYLRDDREFRNVWLVERPQTDFGVTMARLLVFAAYQSELYAALSRSADPTLAGVAGKAVKEVAYHLDHAARWVVRLGDGTEESHARMQAALEAEWPFVDELFTPADAGLVEQGIAVDPAALRPAVLDRIAAVVSEATLSLPERRTRHRRWPPRPAHRAPRLPARGDAAPRPLTPGSDVVIPSTLTRAWQVAATVLDPELPVVTIEDLGHPPRRHRVRRRAGPRRRSPRRTPAARRWRPSAPT